MLSAQIAIKGYNTAVVSYTDCLRKDGGTEKDIISVMDQLERMAGQFNAELRAFKQKSGAL